MIKFLRVLIVLTLFSCNESELIKGYYVGPKPELFGENNVGVNRSYYRISGDTIVQFSTNLDYFMEGDDNYMDSIRLVWNGRYYEDVYNELKFFFPYRINDSTEIDVRLNKFGNHKFKIREDGKLKFSIDTTKNYSEVHMSGNRNIEYLLEPVNKIYIKNSIKKDRKKDSLIFNTPDIPDEEIKDAVQLFFDYEYDGDFVVNSLKITRNPGEFILKFSSKKPYTSTIVNHRYLFDFTLLDYKVKKL